MTKTPAEIELMAEAGRLLALVFPHLDSLQLAGLCTLEINNRVEAFIVDKLAARPASKGQYGYGFVLNSSRNEVVCHGVPSPDEFLRDGDIVNLDITLEVEFRCRPWPASKNNVGSASLSPPIASGA